MFSTKLDQAVPGFDEVIGADASDFEQSGLKVPSVIGVARLAVVSEEMLVGRIGEISDERLHRIQKSLADWIQSGVKRMRGGEGDRGCSDRGMTWCTR